MKLRFAITIQKKKHGNIMKVIIHYSAKASHHNKEAAHYGADGIGINL
jgi:hypothetical protein